MQCTITFDPSVDPYSGILATVDGIYSAPATSTTSTSTSTITPTASGTTTADNTVRATATAVKALMDEHGISESDIQGSGKGGRIIKSDVVQRIAELKVSGATGDPDPDPLGEDPLGEDPLGEDIDPAPTRAEVLKALKDYAALEGKDNAIKILTDNGAQSISELDEASYRAVIDACK